MPVITKTTILLLFLISGLGIFAQNISKSDFRNSEWFTNVNGKNLFKSDTLALSKIVNIEPKRFTKMSPFVKMDYLKTNLFSTLEFKKDDLFIEEVDKEWCGFNFSDQINWKYDGENQNLRFYKNETLIAEYKIISQKTEIAKWNNNVERKPIELSADILTLKLSKLKK